MVEGDLVGALQGNGVVSVDVDDSAAFAKDHDIPFLSGGIHKALSAAVDEVEGVCGLVGCGGGV